MTPAEAVYAFVRTVPPGTVVSYGQIAGLVTEVSVSARQVGGIMQSAPEGVPWQRVVGSDGGLPIGKRSAEMGMLQRRLLEQEGVAFLSDGRVDMTRHRWSADTLGGLFEER